MAGNSNWLMDDLDGGLSTDLFNLSGLGNDLTAEPQAYKMSDVLNLPIFKDSSSSSLFEELPVASQKHNIEAVLNHNVKQEESIMSCSNSKKRANNSDISSQDYKQVREILV